MGFTDHFPENPVQIDTVTELETAFDDVIPVVSIDHGQSVMDDLYLVLTVAQESKRVLLGFTGDGWEVIESVSGDKSFETSEEDVYDFLDRHDSLQWYAEHGGNPNAGVYTMGTNAPGAPEFVKEEPGKE